MVLTGLLYVLLVLATVGAWAAVLLPMYAGERLTGQYVAGASFWSALLAYVISRRRKKTKTVAWLTPIGVFIATFLLIGALDGAVNRDRYALEREFAKNPVLETLRGRDRKAYDAFLMKALKITRGATEKDNLASAIATEMRSLTRSYLLRASDSSLIQLYQAQLGRLRALLSTDPEYCYWYGRGEHWRASSKRTGATEQRDILTLLATVVMTDAKRPEQPADRKKAEDSLGVAYSIAEARLGSEARVLDLVDDPKGNYAGACRGQIALMQSILGLPRDESANVIRWLSGGS